MPATSPFISPPLRKVLNQLGKQIRLKRKALGLTAVETAEAAAMSRLTLHRIERGEPSVTMGAYLSIISALGLNLELAEVSGKKKRESQTNSSRLSKKVRLADFPQLKKLAWQLKKNIEISPREALEIYERNWKHIDLKAMKEEEREFIDSLLEAFGRERLLV